MGPAVRKCHWAPPVCNFRQFKKVTVWPGINFICSFLKNEFAYFVKKLHGKTSGTSVQGGKRGF